MINAGLNFLYPFEVQSGMDVLPVMEEGRITAARGSPRFDGPCRPGSTT